ncbi:MAG: PepSY-like domain-containing protein [Limisphaerales bacterium]
MRGASGTQTGGRANPAGSVNAIGGASVIEANPNNSGASQSGITATAAPGTSQGAQAGQSLQVNTLPAGVQNTLGGFSANGSLGSVTAVPGQPGTFRATVTQNGQPMEITVGANGQILSRTPLAGSSLNTGAANLNANAGVPGTTPFVTGAAFAPTPVVIDDLPNTVQEAVRAQLGAAEANRIMQLRTANGVNYMVSYDQNGRPMTLMVGPDGRVISNGPAAPTATARATTADRTTNATRDVSMTLDDLPSNVEDVLKQTAPYAEVRTVTREQRVGGDVYVIAVREGDRAGDITIDANGKLIRDTRRDLSVLTPRTPTQAEEKAIGMPYDSLPVAIKNAVKAYAASSDIRSVTLGLDNDSRTVYDVIFYRDGRRDRMVIRKDGTLMRIEENVSPALEYASTKPGVIALGDLPQEVQDTVRRQTDNVVVKEIGTKEVANQTVYAVRWEANGAPVELLVSRDGTIIQPEGSTANESAGAPAIARLDREEAATVKIVDDTPGTQRATENVGTAARSEQGLSVSTDVNRSERPPSEVKLSDAPQPVQDTAKKIAGSGTIESISPKLEASGMVYEVRYLDDGQLRTVKIDRSGKVQPESTSP